MISVLPGSSHAFERSDLLKAAQLLLGSLRQEFAPSALADQAVNLAHENFRDDDVGSSYAHFGPLNVNRMCDFLQRA
jgi:hypothetical protein